MAEYYWCQRYTIGLRQHLTWENGINNFFSKEEAESILSYQTIAVNNLPKISTLTLFGDTTINTVTDKTISITCECDATSAVERVLLELFSKKPLEFDMTVDITDGGGEILSSYILNDCRIKRYQQSSLAYTNIHPETLSVTVDIIWQSGKIFFPPYDVIYPL